MEHDNLDTAGQPARQAPAQASGFVRWAIIGALGLVAVGGIGVAAAVSQDFMRPGFAHAAWGGGWGGDGPRGGMHGPRHGGPGFAGPAQIFKQLELTDEQEDKIFAIMDNVRSQARPLMREFRDTREDVTELLAAATVDKAALETLRADRVAKIDAASKTLTDALAQAAEVLTPEQRAKLKDVLENAPRGRW